MQSFDVKAFDPLTTRRCATRWQRSASVMVALGMLFQSEQTRADAERFRAVAEADVQRRVLEATLRGLDTERENVRRVLEALDKLTDPAARDSVDAAVATRTAGKGDSLRVLTARRDFAMVRVRKLELVAHEWSIVSDIVALTGELP
jgi:cobalt-zinc-cadmium efflux system outer membrane protein